MSTSPPTYLIFGAYGGIGSALARTLHAQGARLALSGRDPERLGALADQLNAFSVVADTTDFAAVDATVSSTMDRFQQIDGMALCVGSLMLKPAHMTRPDEWLTTLHTTPTNSAGFAGQRQPASVRDHAARDT